MRTESKDNQDAYTKKKRLEYQLKKKNNKKKYIYMYLYK